MKHIDTYYTYKLRLEFQEHEGVYRMEKLFPHSPGFSTLPDIFSPFHAPFWVLEDAAGVFPRLATALQPKPAMSDYKSK